MSKNKRKVRDMIEDRFTEIVFCNYFSNREFNASKRGSMLAAIEDVDCWRLCRPWQFSDSGVWWELKIKNYCVNKDSTQATVNIEIVGTKDGRDVTTEKEVVFCMDD